MKKLLSIGLILWVSMAVALAQEKAEGTSEEKEKSAWTSSTAWGKVASVKKDDRASVTTEPYVAKFKPGPDRRIHIEISGGNLNIEGHDVDEIVIEAKGFRPPPKRAEGLTPVFASASENTGIGLEVKTVGNDLSIVKAITQQDIHYTIKVPAKANLKIEETQWFSQKFNIQNIQGEIEVDSKNNDLTLTDITGPVVANSTSGNIVIVFTSLNQSQPSSIVSTAGFVDITLPAKTKAELDVATNVGDIYTNFSLDHDPKSNQVGYGNRIKAKVNGGGVAFSIKSFSDNVYLRKKE